MLHDQINPFLIASQPDRAGGDGPALVDLNVGAHFELCLVEELDREGGKGPWENPGLLSHGHEMDPLVDFGKLVLD